jgi:selenocysteine lyase/cysteine desulfurase
MGVNPYHLALTKNTAHGVSILADGFNWTPGDEIVFADCEYPANSYPWLSQQIDRGVVCKVVKTRPDGTVPIEDYATLVNSKTKVIAVSWVQFATGYRADLKALADLAHSVDAFLVVDVIQGLGGFPINLSELGVDAAATGSQKWLLGPMGVGGLYISPKMLEQMRLVNVGALSVNNVQAYSTLELDVKPNAQRYEEGTPNICGYIGLNESIKLVHEFGIENAEKNILDINKYASDKLVERGFEIFSPTDDSIRSGILMFNKPGVESDIVVKELVSNKVNVVIRGGNIRFAPHHYTTHEDIDRAIEALEQII